MVIVMSRFLVSSISIASVLVALTPLFSQAQTKPDLRYWRTFELQMGLGLNINFLQNSFAIVDAVFRSLILKQLAH